MNDEIQQLVNDAPEILEGASSYQVTCREEYLEAGEYLQEIKSIRNVIETERVKITRPANESLRNTNAFFAKADAPYEASETILRGKISAYLDAARAIEREAMRTATTMDALVIATEAAPTLKGLGVRSTFDVTVTNPELVPDEWWVIDEKAIRAAVKASKGRLEIPGVTVTQGTGLTVSVKK